VTLVTGATVVTGATGHVGSVLVRGLLTAGYTGVRALVGPSGRVDALAGLDVETARADVRDHDSLLRVFAGAETVFHTAGIVSIGSRGLERLRATNVEGTRNVLAACREAGVGRLVYTSTVHALAEPARGIALDEEAPLDPAGVRGPYAKSKAEATRLVFAAAAEGLDAVVVFPSGVIGPYDLRPSHTGNLVRLCAKGRLPVYVDGAYNFVDVRDVAQGTIAAAERGRRGEGYVLAGNEVSVAELMGTIAELTGVSAPRFRLPFGVTRSVSFILPAYYGLRREQPLFTSYSLDVISSNSLMCSDKARRELGFVSRPFRETIADTLDWMRDAHIL